jgi:hypothetical protein
MPRPKGWIPYTLKDGTPVPGVTSIISRFKDSGALIWWAWNEGHEGRDYRVTRDAAANAGTIAHGMVDAAIRRHSYMPPADADAITIERAVGAFNNFQAWSAQTNLKPVETEQRLVSEKYAFGGTLDAMLIGGKLSLGDWKTSNRIYEDHLVQLAAYGILWAENYPDRPIEGGYHLLRFAKDAPDFSHHHYGELNDAARGFLLMRELYDISQRLKARVA